MKKLLSLALALGLTFSLAACGGSMPAADPTPAPAGTDAADTAAEPEAETPAPEGYTPDTFALAGEQVLLDQDGVKVTATGLQYVPGENGRTKFELSLVVENNTDQHLAGSFDCAINGEMAYLYLHEEGNEGGEWPALAPGTSATWIGDLWFESLGLTDLNEVAPTQWLIQPVFQADESEEFPRPVYTQGEKVELQTTATGTGEMADWNARELDYSDEAFDISYESAAHSAFGDGAEYLQIDLYVCNHSGQDMYLIFTEKGYNGVALQDGGEARPSIPVFDGTASKVTLLKSVGADTVSYADLESLTYCLQGALDERTQWEGAPAYTSADFTLEKGRLMQNFTDETTQ